MNKFFVWGIRQQYPARRKLTAFGGKGIITENDRAE